MKTQADKTQQDESKSLRNSVAQKQSGDGSAFQFVDNRPEVIAQRKLQEMIYHSPRTKQLHAFQEMAGNNSPAKQPMQMKALEGASDVAHTQGAVLQLTEKALTDKALKNVLKPLGYLGADPRVNSLSGSVSYGDSKVAKIHATQYLANTSQKKIEKDTPIADIMRDVFGGSYPKAHHVTAEVFGEKNPKKNPHYFWDGTYVANDADEVEESDMAEKLTTERDRIETILKRDSWWTM